MSALTGGMILIVEDDPGVARLEVRTLERLGYRVRSVSTVEEATALIGTEALDMIVLDYRLPGDRNGVEFYLDLKAAGHHIPAIIVTGFGDEAVVIQSLRAGVLDFVTKSADYLEYLPLAVERVMKQIRSERQFRALFESTADAVLITDDERHYVDANPAACKLLGMTFEEICTRRIDDVTVPELRDRLAEVWPSFLQTGAAQGGWRLLRPDGSVRFVEYSARANFLPGRHMGSYRDVTERHEAEQRIHDQAALLDKATDAIFVRDLDDRIQYWNRSAELLYGWAAAEVVGKDTKTFLYRELPPAFQIAHRTVSDKGEWHGELKQVTRAGQEVIVQCRWTMVRDNKGRPRSVLAVNTDITEAKKAEAQFLRVQRMESLGTLAGGIAHDLNNMLTPLTMGIQLLQMKQLDESSQSLLKTMEASCARGTQMVKQILSFARGAGGQHDLLQLRHLLKEIEKLLEHTFPKSIAIEVSVPKDLWTLSADPTQLHQVLMNLCVNARDAMPEGGRLIVAANNAILDEPFARLHPNARPGPYVRLIVRDTGTGIPPDVIDKIFDPFFTTKETGKGTGLGLATTIGIVKAHGGFIDVHSDVGKGSSFTIYLPAKESADTRLAQEQLSQVPLGKGELILAVDDETSIREIIRSTLEANGYRVLTARDGTEAWALYANAAGEIRAVIVDMMMPIMDGPTTIRALRKLNPTVPIIAASGLTPPGQETAPAALGVHAVLTKPFTAMTLLTTLHQVLGLPSNDDTCLTKG